MNAALRLMAAGIGLPLLIMTGCGLAAAPQPPSLKLPEPVTDLTAQRTGDQVELRWNMPKRATDKVLLSGDQKVQVCRRVDSGPCAIVGNLLLAPESSGTFIDSLPAALVSGPPHALGYTVELENHAGNSAGPSNVAVTASGPAPLKLGDLQAKVQADGVVLSWTAEDDIGTIRIHRILVQRPGMQTPRTPFEQTLEFSGRDQGQVLDRDAALGQTYNYSAQRIAKLTLEGQSIEVASSPSETITVDARDLFPPAVPKGLEAVANPEARSIDLSWQPNTESDLAGYFVYRQEAGSSAPVRISASVQSAPSFRDLNVQPGHTYEYLVSAVDHNGNESSRSTGVKESLPLQ